MPEIKISESKSLVKSIAPAGGSVIQKASGTIGDIISLISKGEQLVSHIENIVGMFKGREGAGSSIIQSKDTSPPITSIQEPKAPPPAPAAAKQKIDDKSMEAYFTSPEGLKKIADAIDKMVPLIGDLRLSEVKKAITDNISPKKKEVKK
ncbi:hypothetical protein ES702_07157 [subsurface metagenome]